MNVVTWIVALEILSLAFLPLTFWAMGALPDRGYIFASILGLLLVTYVTWLIGLVIPIGSSPVLPAAVLLLSAGIGWWRWGGDVVSGVRRLRGVILVEEGIFLVALVIWSVLRVYSLGSAINHTEQFMDMALLNASYHSASYPPYDPWMSGLSVHYYYLGYMLFATLGKLALTPPAVAFNLANSTIVACVAGAAYSLGYALTRRLSWAALAPLFVGFIGNWHAALWEAAHGACATTGTFYGWFWPSTRVLGSGATLANWGSPPAPCTAPYTAITEYPLFSFILGDLHPHVMALPFVLLVLGLAASILLSGGAWDARKDAGRFVLLAVAAGALFGINSWDFPTYLSVVVAAIIAHAYLHDDSPRWWQRPVVTCVGLAILAVVLYAPFYVELRGLSHGIGRVTTPTDFFEFIQVFGLFALAIALLLSSLGLLLQPAAEDAEESTAVPELIGESGQASDGLILTVSAAAILVAGILLHAIVLALLLLAAAGALILLYRVLNAEQPNRGDALALILVIVGVAAVALPELVYLRDAFDNSALYRMNTVFKFYYQGWILLGVAAAYGAYRSWIVLRRLVPAAAARSTLVAVAAGTAAAGIYTFWTPTTNVAAGPQSLDGSAWVAQQHPGDAAGIHWLEAHVSGSPTILEAVGAPGSPGGDYTPPAAEYSTFTGLPTVMGWTGHEEQWGRSSATVGGRESDVVTIYKSLDWPHAASLLHEYRIQYVVVGSNEQALYGNSGGLNKFGQHMRTAFSAPGITIYTW